MTAGVDLRVANRPPVTRREFLNTAALLAGSAAVGCSSDKVAGLLSLFDAGVSKFDHVIVVMQENRSFDHLLGWAPLADGQQAGLTFQDDTGVSHDTYPLAPDFQGCGHPDPGHSYGVGRIQYDGGLCDGFLRGGNDIFAIGYYRREDLEFFGQAMGDWTIADRYFCSVLGPTFPNRIYQHAGQTDRLINSGTISILPTIWDRLAAAGLAGRYYYHDVPILGLWGAKYQPISFPAARFYTDCSEGTLPNVAFVDPGLTQEVTGTGADDHPYNDVRAGQNYLNGIYTAVTTGPRWDRTVLVINYDEWGGFFDHVPPPLGPITASEAALGNDGRLGFRTPLMLVSPYARANHVASAIYDHASVLKLIENRWNLQPLAIRDAKALSIGTALDFRQPPRAAPQYSVAPILAGTACPATPNGALTASAIRGASGAGSEADKWGLLYDLAKRSGWSLP
jgi:phospholipase C